MPDLLIIPSTATQAQIVDLIDRLRLGDAIVMQGRVLGLTALSTMALSGSNSLSRDRAFFPAMDALIANTESHCRTPEAAARFIVEQGVVPGAAEPEWKSQRIAKNYRKDRKLKRLR